MDDLGKWISSVRGFEEVRNRSSRDENMDELCLWLREIFSQRLQETDSIKLSRSNSLDRSRKWSCSYGERIEEANYRTTVWNLFFRNDATTISKSWTLTCTCPNRSRSNIVRTPNGFYFPWTRRNRECAYKRRTKEKRKRKKETNDEIESRLISAFRRVWKRTATK